MCEKNWKFLHVMRSEVTRDPGLIEMNLVQIMCCWKNFNKMSKSAIWATDSLQEENMRFLFARSERVKRIYVINKT